jgi:hypothetical protein
MSHLPTTKVLTFKKQSTGLSTGDTNVSLDSSIIFKDSRTKKQLRILNGYVSTAIPNIFNYGGINTGLIGLSNDGGVNWTTIQLENGIYKVSQINNAINATIASWMTNPSESAFNLYSNSALGKTFIVLDSSKLVVGQIAVDFGVVGSSINTLLGFTNPDSFLVDGTYEADAYPQMDYYGNILSIRIQGLGNLSVVNGSTSNEVATIDLTSSLSNLYKIETIDFWYDIFPVTQINSYKIEFVGSRNRSILWTEHDTQLTIAIREYPN